MKGIILSVLGRYFCRSLAISSSPRVSVTSVVEFEVRNIFTILLLKFQFWASKIDFLLLSSSFWFFFVTILLLVWKYYIMLFSAKKIIGASAVLSALVQCTATVSIQLSPTPQLRTHYLGYLLVETSSCALAHMTFSSCVQCRAFSYERCTAYVYARYKEASVCSIPKIKKKNYYIYY